MRFYFYTTNVKRNHVIQSWAIQWHKSWLTVDTSYLILLIVYFNWIAQKRSRTKCGFDFDWIENEQLFHSMPTELTMLGKSDSTTHSAALKYRTQWFSLIFPEWLVFFREENLPLQTEKKRENFFNKWLSPIQCFCAVFFFVLICDLKVWATMWM